MAKKKKGGPAIGPSSVLKLLRELRGAAKEARPIVVGGDPSFAETVRKGLAADGDASIVRGGDPRGGSIYVYALTGTPGAPEKRELRAAKKAGVPIVAVTQGDDRIIPYVLATDLLYAPRSGELPIGRIAEAIARSLEYDAAPLAGKLPVLREAVSERLVQSFARKNALVGAAIFIPGADMPVMTFNQMRLVLRLAVAHGLEAEPARVAELAGVLGSALGLRYVGRSLLGLIPVAGFAVRAGVGYTGTRAVGEAAVKYYKTID